MLLSKVKKKILKQENILKGNLTKIRKPKSLRKRSTSEYVEILNLYGKK